MTTVARLAAVAACLIGLTAPAAAQDAREFWQNDWRWQQQEARGAPGWGAWQQRDGYGQQPYGQQYRTWRDPAEMPRAARPADAPDADGSGYAIRISSLPP